jgi:hypothetical protein
MRIVDFGFWREAGSPSALPLCSAPAGRPAPARWSSLPRWAAPGCRAAAGAGRCPPRSPRRQTLPAPRWQRHACLPVTSLLSEVSIRSKCPSSSLSSPFSSLPINSTTKKLSIKAASNSACRPARVSTCSGLWARLAPKAARLLGVIAGQRQTTPHEGNGRYAVPGARQLQHRHDVAHPVRQFQHRDGGRAVQVQFGRGHFARAQFVFQAGDFDVVETAVFVAQFSVKQGQPFAAGRVALRVGPG